MWREPAPGCSPIFERPANEALDAGNIRRVEHRPDICTSDQIRGGAFLGERQYASSRAHVVVNLGRNLIRLIWSQKQSEMALPDYLCGSFIRDRLQYFDDAAQPVALDNLTDGPAINGATFAY